MNKNKGRVALAVAVAVAVPVGLGLAAPAQASTFKDGCTVFPRAPYFAGTYTAGNVPEVYYPYDVSCLPANASRTVEVETETWESDLAGVPGDIDSNGVNNADDEYIGHATTSRNFSTLGGFQTVRVKGVLPHTDSDGNDEVYHKVKFRVIGAGIQGSWTSFELTQATRIWW